MTDNNVTDETTNSQNFGPEPEQVARFIEHWAASGGAERANFPSFAHNLCDLLAVPPPEPTKTDVAENAYVFERDVTFQNQDGSTSPGRIDLYKRGCFVLEAKQGSEQATAEDADEFALSGTKKKTKRGTAVRGTKGWDDAMVKARGQAEQYARALPTDEGWPPFLIVVDVGHSIELFADFTRSGRTYLPFPDPGSFRIKLEQLADDEQREKLHTVWTDPLSLDPSRRSAKVTRELADRLARLAKSMEGSGYDPSRVSQFLMRCLFTMFAEDVELIPTDSFTTLLSSIQEDDVQTFPDMVRTLWETMDKGEFSPILRKKLRRFNGGLFEDCEALPLSKSQLELLIEASKANWREVEPAIFGTLLERALDPVERHKLGAHYTPRAYVERLVMPTIIEPLRDEWDAVRTAAILLATKGEAPEAHKIIRDFHAKLCNTRILDPACGSGNFLYVALEHMKRLEGEVLNTLQELGDRYRNYSLTVDPHQFLGIEVNPRAAAIADLVLWIGYLQWHIRTRDLSQIAEPIIRKFYNIKCRDAVLAWDAVEPVVDDNGEPVTRWDGRTTKPHPVTGEEVPDDSARVPVLKYINPRKAEWPQADFIVGNPPFVGNKRMRDVLGSEYVATLRKAYSELPESIDYVMYWWAVAGRRCTDGAVFRFGLITTNSITQTFNARLTEELCSSGRMSLVFAIADHPWVDSADGADVRIAMSVGEPGVSDGEVWELREETVTTEDEARDTEFIRQRGAVTSQFSIGFDPLKLSLLKSNAKLACPGVQLSGQGFVLSPDDVEGFSEKTQKSLIRPYITGRDLSQTTRTQFVLDTFGLTESDLRGDYPDAYQWLNDRVRPERIHNPREKYRRDWWLHSEPRGKFREALAGLSRVIGTSRTARHRTFQFVPSETLGETKVLVFAFDDACILGVLSSRTHVTFANITGGWLGVGNDSTYNHSECLVKFPFPVASESQQSRIRELAEQLDAHRKRQQAQHPKLTMTGMYNVLEKLRQIEWANREGEAPAEPKSEAGTEGGSAGASPSRRLALTDKERTIHEQGLVSVLKQIHDDLDAAVFEAYGWPVTLTDEEILERLVVLNAERAAEEQRGLIRWLRPEFQNPSGDSSRQKQLAIGDDSDADDQPAKKGKARKQAATKKLPLPKKLAEQVVAIRQQLATSREPLTATDMAKRFSRAKPDQVEELLQSLTVLGSAREVEPGKYVSA